MCCFTSAVRAAAGCQCHLVTPTPSLMPLCDTFLQTARQLPSPYKDNPPQKNHHYQQPAAKHAWIDQAQTARTVLSSIRCDHHLQCCMNQQCCVQGRTALCLHPSQTIGRHQPKNNNAPACISTDDAQRSLCKIIKGMPLMPSSFTQELWL